MHSTSQRNSNVQPNWTKIKQHNQNNLKQSQRDLLDTLDNVLNKFANKDVAELLWSYLSLQKHIEIKNGIINKIKDEQQLLLSQIMSNITKCANNAVDHTKYEWLICIAV